MIVNAKVDKIFPKKLFWGILDMIFKIYSYWFQYFDWIRNQLNLKKYYCFI